MNRNSANVKETMMSIGSFLVGIIIVLLAVRWRMLGVSSSRSLSKANAHIEHLVSENLKLKTRYSMGMEDAANRICDREGKIAELENEVKRLKERLGESQDPHDKFRPHAAR